MTVIGLLAKLTCAVSAHLRGIEASMLLQPTSLLPCGWVGAVGWTCTAIARLWGVAALPCVCANSAAAQFDLIHVSGADRHCSQAAGVVL